MTTRIALATTIILALVLTGTAQDVLHYKFDAGGGQKVINYAARSGIAPTEGTIEFRGSTPPVLWATGQFGSALAGDPLGQTPRIQVNTGWDCGFTGSFTIATFLKLREPVPANGNAEFVRSSTNNGSFVAQIAAHDEKLYVSWPSGEWVKSTTNVYSLVAKGWVHVALVVDETTKYGTFYVNGNAELPQRLGFTLSVAPSLTNLRIGTNSTYGSFDIDEFRFRLGTATAAEIMKWATENPAADGAYGKGCWPKGRPVLLDSNSDQHGPPAIGNSNYVIELYGLPGSTFIFGVGTNRLSLAATPLPLDLGFLDPSLKGCNWESSGDVAWLDGVIPTTGQTVLPFPVPQIPSLVGITLYSQAVLYSPVLKRYMGTNAFATAIGK